MKLDELYNEVSLLISKIDFNHLWNGFYPLKFALYNDKECYFNGEYILKNDNFLGNTSIKYNGEWIAIWNVMEDINPVILCSKMIHEMFHGFQQLHYETRFPDELDAIYNYKYSNENLSLKFKENQILVELNECFNLIKYNELLEIKKYRYNNFKYEFIYESKIETIEGSANYIELEVLRQLSFTLYENKLTEMKNLLLNKNNLLPVRIVSYDIGALTIKIIKDNDIMFNYDFNNLTINEQLIKNTKYKEFKFSLTMENEINNYYQRGKNIITKTLENNIILVDKRVILLGVNVYNAFYFNNYIISKYFVMYKEDNDTKVLYGDFLIEITDNKMVNKIYKIK